MEFIVFHSVFMYFHVFAMHTQAQVLSTSSIFLLFLREMLRKKSEKNLEKKLKTLGYYGVTELVIYFPHFLSFIFDARMDARRSCQTLSSEYLIAVIGGPVALFGGTRFLT